MLIIDSTRQKTYCKSLIDEMPEDGSMTVEIKKAGMDSTAKQRRLNWLWCTEIAQSGLGADDTKEDVYTRAKYQFARPILLRDSETFGAIFAGFEIVIKDYDTEVKRQCYMEFSRDYISTEQMTKRQRAEFLTDLQGYWIRKGVNLTDPATQGLDKYLGFKPKERRAT